MIARTWRGWTSIGDLERYARYLTATGIRALRSTPGNRAAYLMHRPVGKRAEFVVVSLWDSLEDIEAFAGEDVERAVYFPEDHWFLVDREDRVSHYQVAELDPESTRSTSAASGRSGPDWL